MASGKGIYVGVVAIGAVFAYAGIKGYSIPQTIQDVIQGKTPVGQIQVTGLSTGALGAPSTGASMTGSSGAPGGAIGPGAAAAQAWARSHLADYGWGPEQMLPLTSLWAGESGWNVLAANPTSGAYGIPQSLPGNKMASMGADWKTNPVTQMRWGLKYIKDVYGSPSAALATWQSRSPHWY